MKLIALLTCLVFVSHAHAVERGTLRASLLAGQVGLFGDPADGGANALGLAGFGRLSKLASRSRLNFVF